MSTRTQGQRSPAPSDPLAITQAPATLARIPSWLTELSTASLENWFDAHAQYSHQNAASQSYFIRFGANTLWCGDTGILRERFIEIVEAARTYA